MKNLKRLKKIYYEIEEIIERQIINKKKWYLVKWKGFDSSENTWEPEQSFAKCKYLMRNYDRELKRNSSRRKKNVVRIVLPEIPTIEERNSLISLIEDVTVLVEPNIEKNMEKPLEDIIEENLEEIIEQSREKSISRSRSSTISRNEIFEIDLNELEVLKPKQDNNIEISENLNNFENLNKSENLDEEDEEFIDINGIPQSKESPKRIVSHEVQEDQVIYKLEMKSYNICLSTSRQLRGSYPDLIVNYLEDKLLKK
jgi:hypothetical protein